MRVYENLSKFDTTTHLDFDGEMESEKDKKYMSEYFTTPSGTYIRITDKYNHYPELHKLCDVELRIIYVFTVKLFGSESKPYIMIEVVKDGVSTHVSAPCHLFGKKCKETKRFEDAGGVISNELGRALFFAAKIGVRTKQLEHRREVNLNEPKYSEDDRAEMTSLLDFRKQQHSITRYFTTQKGTFISEIDVDGYESVKQISEVQIVLSEYSSAGGANGTVFLMVTNKHGQSKEVSVPMDALVEMKINRDTDQFYRAGGTMTPEVGRAIYHATILSKSSNLI